MKQIRLFLISLLMTGALNVNANVVESLNYLIQQREVVQIFEDVNVWHIQSLKSCLCQVDRKNIGTEICSNGPQQTDPTYLQKYLSLNGELLERSFDCKKILDGFLYNKVKDNYKKAKMALALSRTQLKDHNKNTDETLPGERIMKVSLLQNHPDVISALTIGKKIKKFNPYTKEETKILLEEYDTASREFCSTFYNQNNNNSKYQTIYNQSHFKVCKLLLTHFGEWPKLDQKTQSLMIQFQQDYFFWVRAKRNKFRNSKHKEYIEAINKSPVILLVSSEKPSNLELYKALVIIEKNAIERQKTLEENEKGQNIIKEIGDFKNGSLSAEESNLLEQKLLSYSSFSYAKDITLTLLQNKGIEIDNSVVEKLNGRFSKTEMNKALKEVGIVVAANVACFLPVGRLIGVVKSLLFKSGCLMSVGLPVNVYFMAHAAIDYNESLVKFLATTDGRYYWAKIENLNQAKRSLYLSGILLPIGVSASEYGKFYKTIRPN